ncbi:MAG: hypothetical protein KZQ89_11295 [Candidatus Thiodiazotropha sp. (ex Lucinoma kastoroae)]|nr:hypothetical protein [Candidatus Thiodiazotropha sp. (ex Lucinoma kastoroae)]
MTHIIQVHRPGGSEVFNWENVELSNPETGEVRLHHTAIGWRARYAMARIRHFRPLRHSIKRRTHWQRICLSSMQ